ncbi:hypothetical protein QW060_14275 [Myroides ceti]|uniref:Uncharacterized protein n=1 Tax=Paenimyroides ceti TaxID=395087 RepID=A0ABT8CUV2_9FLAO|nr:hypothetical protein [Paenimyroides ceti]MDN3708268.1 hypothetical protein [Paenimyroides ceti]
MVKPETGIPNSSAFCLAITMFLSVISACSFENCIKKSTLVSARIFLRSCSV